jgi:hypothetical protein
MIQTPHDPGYNILVCKVGLIKLREILRPNTPMLTKSIAASGHSSPVLKEYNPVWVVEESANYNSNCNLQM